MSCTPIVKHFRNGKRIPGLQHAKSGSQILRLGATINEQGIPNYKLLAELSDQVFIEIVLFVAVVHVALSCYGIFEAIGAVLDGLCS